MKLDFEAIRDKIVNYKKNFTEITANDLPVFTFDVSHDLACSNRSRWQTHPYFVHRLGRHTNHLGMG